MFVALLIVVCAIILAWNFYPPFRAKMRGLSTIVEGVLGTALHYFGVFAGAMEDVQNSGYLPEDWTFTQYIPFIILAWIVVKRVQTTSKVGGKE